VQSLKLISELDKVKIRMETVTQALEEAEKLAKLTENIENVFATKDFQKVRSSIPFDAYNSRLLQNLHLCTIAY
jgi:hypothetical protein